MAEQAPLQPASSLPPLADATVSAPAQSQHQPHNTHSRSPPAPTKPACSDTVQPDRHRAPCYPPAGCQLSIIVLAVSASKIIQYSP